MPEESMPEKFDPYYQWLGIPPKHQPPSHYRLLGLEDFEPNPNVIENAADRQMAHVRLHQTGKHGPQCQEICNEITAAKLCLLNAAKKAAYDGQLRADQEVEDAPAPPSAEPPAASPPRKTSKSSPRPVARPIAVPESEPAETPAFVTTGTAGARSMASRRRLSLGAQAAIAGGVLAIIVLIVVFTVLRDDGETIAQRPDDQSAKKHPVDKPPVKKKKSEGGLPANKEDTKKPPEKKKDDPPVKEKTPKEKEKEKTSPPPPVGSQMADLLRAVDFDRDIAAGKWSLEQDLTGKPQDVPGMEFGLLRIPHKCPEEYDLLILPKRLDGEGALSVGLVSGKNRVVLDCEAGDDELQVTIRNLSEGAETTPAQGRPLKLDGQTPRIICRIRKSGLTVLANSKELLDWRGESTRWLLPIDWADREIGDGLFLGVGKGGYRVERFLLRVPSGSGEPPKNQPPVVVKRQPAPEAEDIVAAVQEVKEEYKDDYAGAVKPDDKARLAEDIFSTATTDNHPPAKRYALLSESRDLAAAAADVEAALRAVEQLAKWFIIDELAGKVELLITLGSAGMPSDKRKLLVEKMLGVVEDASAADRFDVAAELAVITYKNAVKAGDTELRKQAAGVRDRAVQFHQWWQGSTVAATTLTDSPDDPAANTIMGKYLCFVMDEWETGLAHLAKGADEKFAKAARLELKKPTTARRQADAGEAWFDLALSAKGYAKLVRQVRAHHWYQQAVEKLTDDDKRRVETRLALLKKALGDVPGATVSVLSERILGKFHLIATARKDGSKSEATFEFNAKGEVIEGAEIVGLWVVDGPSVRVTFNEKDRGAVKLRGRGQDAFTGVQTLGSDDVVTWSLKRLKLVAIWNVFIGFRNDDTPQRIELFSNGRGTSPLGELTWRVSGNNLILGGLQRLEGTFRLEQGGKTFRGQKGFRFVRGERLPLGSTKENPETKPDP